MHQDLTARRRALLVTYRRYLQADRAWSEALGEVRAWFPKATGANRAAIGNPGSRVRRLYERRERAILQLQTAREKLATAKLRLEARDRGRAMPTVFLIGMARSRDTD